MARKKGGNNKETQKVVKLVRKSNQLVEARYKFDIWETRVFTKMLTMIRLKDADFKVYRIYVKDVIEEFGLERDRRAYQRIKMAGERLNDKTVRIFRDTEEGLKEFKTKIVAGIESFVHNEDGKYIDVSFDPRMKPYLLALKSKFTIYDARNILKLPSTYSIRIYELLKQYERIGKRKFSVIGLKEMIGALEEIQDGEKRVAKDHYPLYGNFRQKVLLKAQRDLGKYTDIAFTFEPQKKGRKITDLVFFITKNIPEDKQKKEKYSTDAIPVEVKHVDVAIKEDLYNQVSQWMTRNSFDNLVEIHSLTQVRNAIFYTLNRLKEGDEIKNIAGYIIAMAKETMIIDRVGGRKAKVAQQRVQKETKLVAKQQLETELKQFYGELRQKEDAIIKAIFIEMPEIEATILEEAKGKRLAKYDHTKSISENMENPLFAAAFRNVVRKKFTKRFTALDKDYQPKIKKTKQQLEQL